MLKHGVLAHDRHMRLYPVQYLLNLFESACSAAPRSRPTVPPAPPRDTRRSLAPSPHLPRGLHSPAEIVCRNCIDLAFLTTTGGMHSWCSSLRELLQILTFLPTDQLNRLILTVAGTTFTVD